MLKFFIILLLVFYALYRVAFFLFRVFIGNWIHTGIPRGDRSARTHAKHSREGDIHIDKVPNKHSKKRGANYQGGEYVEFEEIK